MMAPSSSLQVTCKNTYNMHRFPGASSNSNIMNGPGITLLVRPRHLQVYAATLKQFNFAGSPLPGLEIADDVDTTAMALLQLPIDHEVAHSVLDEILGLTTPDEIIMV